MLTQQENERLTRVERGTRMGELMRRYRIRLPLLVSSRAGQPNPSAYLVRILYYSRIAEAAMA